MFNTLFSRMLATYLSVMLAILLLLGIIVAGMFQNQYISEQESELRREAEEVTLTIVNKYLDDDKRPVATEELVTTARKYDALLQLVFVDPAYGNVCMYDKASTKWIPVADTYLSDEASEIIEGANTRIENNVFRGWIDIPTMSIACPISTGEGTVVGAMFFHTDMSRKNDSIRKVYLDVLLSACVSVILAFLAVSYITGRMTKPITDMNNIVRRFSKGEFSARVKIASKDEVGQLGQSFNVMADELDTLEHSRRSFVANVSHELRSPLTSMRGFLEAMQDGTIPPEEYGKYLGVVIDETKRMTAMVNDLLDLARIESGQTVLKLEAFDINELIIRTLLTFEARINAANIDVNMDFDAEHTTVEADADQIAQVVRNLIDNAIKFSPAGGTLSLKTETGKRNVRVSVKDEGVGIAAEDLPYVFDRFYKAEKAHTPSGSSTGIGLSIVKRIVEQHGETITVESPPGNGTCFTFTLKLCEQQAKPRPYAAQRR